MFSIQEAKNLSAEDDKKLRLSWSVRDNKYMKHWTNQAVTHSYFTNDVRIENYIYNTGRLMEKFLGEGSEHNIKKILEDLEYFPGFFYDAKTMMEKLSSRVG